MVARGFVCVCAPSVVVFLYLQCVRACVRRVFVRCVLCARAVFCSVACCQPPRAPRLCRRNLAATGRAVPVSCWPAAGYLAEEIRALNGFHPPQVPGAHHRAQHGFPARRGRGEGGQLRAEPRAGTALPGGAVSARRADQGRLRERKLSRLPARGALRTGLRRGAALVLRHDYSLRARAGTQLPGLCRHCADVPRAVPDTATGQALLGGGARRARTRGRYRRELRHQLEPAVPTRGTGARHGTHLYQALPQDRVSRREEAGGAALAALGLPV
nr:MAG: hypothetical protein [Molluscum contagiosum virus]